MSSEENWERTLARLCEASEAQAGEYAIDWPAVLDREAWFLSPELLSLYGTPAYEALDEGARKRLSFFEAVNFFSLNVHGEKSLVAGLALRLYRGDRGPAIDRIGTTSPTRALPGHDAYLHHFLEEENRHMGWFGGFCRRYAGGIYPDKKMALLPVENAAEGEVDFLFFAKVMIFEEIVDAYNARCARDERLHPLARRIHSLHHRDEARHLAFGRRVARDLFAKHAPAWDAAARDRVQGYLLGYLESVWKEYYNPRAYADAGLPGDALALRNQAFDHPAAAARRSAIAGPCLEFLRRHGMLAAGAA
ncbi:MAG: diiron oxygenase [Fibrobacteres bacterium]|jgi:hypothetical protein|nr:diiron oxygenase [Fibrobacterota bacterium]